MPAYGMNDFHAELSTFRRACTNSPDIVHLVDAEHSLMFLPAWLKCIRPVKQTPRVIAMFHQPADILEGLVNKDIVRQVDCVLAVAPEQVEYFLGFMPAHRVKMILHGIDTRHFIPGNRGKDQEKFVCLAAGVWLRDYDAVIETARLLGDDAAFEFHIIASRFSVPEDMHNVIIHRNISDAEMLALYQWAHVLFMPLKTATANNVLLEGCACGLPVISTGLDSVQTYFPGQEAALVHDNRPQHFAEILTDLHRNRSTLELMSQAARARAEELSWENVSRDYMALYHALCS